MKPTNRVQLILKTFQLIGILALLTTAGHAQVLVGSDSFIGSSIDSSKWGSAIVTGSASLSETLSGLQYIDGGTTSNDAAHIPWILNSGSYTNSFSVQLDLTVPTLSLATNQSYGMSVDVVKSSDFNDVFSVGLEVTDWQPNPGRHFYSNFSTAATNTDIFSPTANLSGTVRIRYDAPSATLFADYGDVGQNNWTTFTTQSVAAWGMTSSSTFFAAVGGDTEAGVVITSGNNPSAVNFLAVPEPSSYALLGLGTALAIVVAARRKLKNARAVKAAQFVALLVLIGGGARVSAQTTLNFDSVSVADNQFVDATDYLASNGVTLVNVSTPGSVRIYKQTGIIGSYSSPNYLTQWVSGSPNGITYTMDFSAPLSSLSFFRTAQLTPNLVAAWTATAYAGTTSVGSVGEGSFGGTESAQLFSISGNGITSLTFVANGGNNAGVPSATIDNLTLTPQSVPEPSTYALLGLGVLGVLTRIKLICCRTF